MQITYKKLPDFPIGKNFTADSLWPKIKIDSPYFAQITIVGLIFFVSLVSLFALSQQSLRLDEAQSLWQSSRTLPAALNILAKDVHVPLYSLLLHGWQFLFGNQIPTVRAFSLSFYIFSIPAMYLLAKTAYNRSIALFATLLFGISPFLNWYANEIRMYSMLTFLTILNQYLFLKIYKAGRYPTKSLRYLWAGYIVTAFFGIYTHYFFWLGLLSQAVFYFFYSKSFPPKTFRKLSLIAISLFISLVPWLLYVKHVGEISNATPILNKPGSVNLFNTFSQFIFGFQDDHLNTILVSLWPISVLLMFLSLRKNQKIRPTSVYFFLSTLLPVTAAFIISITLVPLFLTRYLILAAPSLFIFLSWFLTVYSKKLSLSLKTALAILMLLMFYSQVHGASSPVKEDYKDVVQYLDSQATNHDVVVVSAPFTVYPIEYYYSGPSSMVTLPLWDRYKSGPIPVFNEQTLPAEVDQVKTAHEKAFLVLSYNQGYESKIKYYFDTHFQKLSEKNFSPGLNVYVYKLRYDNVTFDSILNSTRSTSTSTDESLTTK